MGSIDTSVLVFTSRRLSMCGGPSNNNSASAETNALFELKELSSTLNVSYDVTYTYESSGEHTAQRVWWNGRTS